MKQTIFIDRFPPSTNALFTNRRQKGAKGRMRTDRYQCWLTEQGLKINRQSPKLMDGRCMVYIAATPPDKRARDIDNMAKPVLDILVSSGVLKDDNINHLKALFMEWVDDGQPGTISVEVKTIE